ncbi:MAG: CotH kinase family protein [Planctomycetota bacterium]|jgi:spore coat protein CotH
MRHRAALLFLVLLLTAAAPDYDVIYDNTRVVAYHLKFSAEDWAALQKDHREYVPATFVFGKETYEKVGVRFKGRVSLQHAGLKKPFKVKFDKFEPKQRFHGIKKLSLHNGFKDPTIMRETLGYEIFRAAGCPASRTSHVRVFVTVPELYDMEYFGLYISVEAVTKDYLKDRFRDASGTLYEGGDFRWHGSGVDRYVPDLYPLRTNKKSRDHEALMHFLKVLNTAETGKLKGELEKVFEVDMFLGWLAAHTVLSDMEGIPAGGSGNCYLYHNPTTGKLVLLPWDLNESFGSTSEGLSIKEVLTLNIYEPTTHPDACPLIHRLLEVPEFLDVYKKKLRALIDGPFSVEAMNAKIDAVHKRIRRHVYSDTKRHYDIDQFERSFTEDVAGLPNPPYPRHNRVIGLKRFVRERVKSVNRQLKR